MQCACWRCDIKVSMLQTLRYIRDSGICCFNWHHFKKMIRSFQISIMDAKLITSWSNYKKTNLLFKRRFIAQISIFWAFILCVLCVSFVQKQIREKAVSQIKHWWIGKRNLENFPFPYPLPKCISISGFLFQTLITHCVRGPKWLMLYLNHNI